jgi:hypothetical protein
VSVRLHVDRLVLHDVELGPGGAELVRAGLQQELARLLAEGRPLAPGAGGAVPVLRAPAVQLQAGTAPEQIGVRVAQAIYGSLR